jgi:hypothetical protein
MHPVAVIFAIMAGGQFFGFLGVLLALPVAAVVMVLLRYARQRYLNSSLYQAGLGTMEAPIWPSESAPVEVKVEVNVEVPATAAAEQPAASPSATSST